MKRRIARDAYAFSLGGFSTKTSLLAGQAIADDRINQAIDERLSRRQEDQPDTERELPRAWGRFWLSKRRRAA